MPAVHRSHYLILFFLLLVMFFTGLLGTQSMAASLPATWRLNQSDCYSFQFGRESIARVIFIQEVGTMKYVFGFYCEAKCDGHGSSYLLSVIFIPVRPEFFLCFTPAVVWSANRNDLVTVNAVLKLTDEGDLVLEDSDKNSTVWSAGTSGKSVVAINLTDTGNLVLLNKNNVAVWQSFDHPTDTLLRGQKLMLGKKLVPRVSSKNWTEEIQLSLTLTAHGLYAVAGTKPPLSYYSFPSELTDDSYAAWVNGTFDLYSGKAKGVINSINVSTDFIRLDYDGHLRAYGHNFFGYFITMGDLLALKTCEYPMACSPYGICSNGHCSCPLPRGEVFDFEPVSLGLPELGCNRKVPLTCEGSRKQVFLEMRGISCFNITTDIMSIDENSCMKACAENCSCEAAFFMSGQGNYERGCLLVSELFSLNKVDETGLIDCNCTVYLKVQNPADKPGSEGVIPDEKLEENFLQTAKSAGLVVAVLSAFLSLVVALFLLWQGTRLNEEMEDDHFEEVPGMPTRFSYTDLKSITNDFSRKLGEGGFGAVFEGALQDGTKVAVKRLDGFRHMKKSFLNEVGTIGSIHHINLVVLLGFCAERSHRLLVYEYMSNGSLDGWIFRDSSWPALDWSQKMDIILDVAKGLHYLHEDCKQKIVHLDIKPQNILLDDNLRGKISDFGLSRLVDRDNGQIQTTTLKGTPGYLAPEWLNGQVTEKADTYSFGVVVLEVILGRKVVGDHWDSDLWKQLEKKAEEGRLMDLIEADSKYPKPDENVIYHVSRAIRVAAWCLHNDFRKRPSMSMVIKVLDGVMEIEDGLVYNFTSHPVSTTSRCQETVLWPSILSGPR